MMRLRPSLPVPRRRPSLPVRRALSRAWGHLRVHPWQLGGWLGAATLLGLVMGGCAKPDPQTQADLVRLGSVVGQAHTAGLRSIEDMAEDLAALQRLGVAVATSWAKETAAEAWSVARGLLEEAGRQILGRALGGVLGGGSFKPSSPRVRTLIQVRKPSASAAAPLLELIRSWSRPSSPGQRVRIGELGGRLALAWAEPLGGLSRRIVLEDQAGAVLWQRIAAWRPNLAEFYPLQLVGGGVLYRDGDSLRLGDELLGAGNWEAYSGHAGGSGASVVGWAACPARPCPAAALWRAPGGWQTQPWNRELFGVALGRAATGTVAIGSRENPSNAGWTLRTIDEGALLRGVVAELQPTQTWRPPAGLSLEDPGLVEGASSPMLIGEAFDVPTQRSSGRVFLAESGQALRGVLKVPPTKGNTEIPGAVHQGVLYVAAELDGQRSGLWRWEGGRLVRAGEVRGAGPWLGLAEGRLWLATSAGLWRVGP